jgi:hypothetical protein
MMVSPRGSRKPRGYHDPQEGSLPNEHDRLKRLVLEEAVLAGSLACSKAPCVLNLPADFRVVGCRFDAARQRAVLVIQSGTFPRVAKGTLIPEFGPQFRNLLTIKRRGTAGVFPAR